MQPINISMRYGEFKDIRILTELKVGVNDVIRNLEKLEDYNREYLENSKIVVKFECKEIGATT